MSPEFRTTRWSVVAAAGGEGTTASRAALGDLVEAYWYPLYAYARRRGLSREAAEDGVQGFFTALVEKGWVAAADPVRGRFRAFLITAFKRHLGRERDRERAQKRGGGRTPLRLDFEDGERRYSLEPAHVETPERLFERRWAMSVLARTIDGLAREMDEAGRSDRWAVLRAWLPGATESRGYAEASERLGMTEGGVKAAVHRLRARYRERLREEIAQTVARPEDVESEIRHLLEALRG